MRARLMAAVARGELRAGPGPDPKIERADLRAWFRRQGEFPKALFPEARGLRGFFWRLAQRWRR